MIKIYECSICKKLTGKIKGEERFTGTREEVRKHLREVHNIKGGRGSKKGNKDKSMITAETLSEDFK